MSKSLIIVMLTLGAGTLAAQDFRAPVPRPRRVAPPPQQPLPPGASQGIIPMAVRSGNPLQVINPRAPARYGNGREMVEWDPNDPGKPKGFKFFIFSW